MKLAINPAQLNDIETILDFMVDYYKIEEVEFDRIKSKRTIEDFISNGTSGSLCMIHLSDEPIGYFCLAYSFTLENYGKDCFVDEIYIKPNFRNQGVGSEVMKYIENYLTDNDFKAIHLIVYDKNPIAYKYYLKNGFHEHKARFMTKLLN
ncbi:MAG: GNAT family N-acetyltransferase [Bacteroidetes bacterium]|nr:GNAT family N-acetyltransferase [Bacteroidota bacterium]